MKHRVHDNDFPKRADGSYDRDRFRAETAEGKSRLIDREDAPTMGEQLLLNAVEIVEPPRGFAADRWRVFIDSLVELYWKGVLDPLAENLAAMKESHRRGEVTDEDLLRYVPESVEVADKECLAALASLDLHFPFRLVVA